MKRDLKAKYPRDKSPDDGTVKSNGGDRLSHPDLLFRKLWAARIDEALLLEKKPNYSKIPDFIGVFSVPKLNVISFFTVL